MKIPIVNYNDHDAATQLIKSIKETGFAVLSNTFIPASLIQDSYVEWAQFFSNSNKNELNFNSETQEGYFPFGSEKAKDSNVADLKEMYHYFPNRSTAPFPFTGELALFLEDLAVEVLLWLERDYRASGNKTPESWSMMVDGSRSTLFRILHYPPLTGQEVNGAVRSAAHEDINFITLLPSATASGLQVKDRNGNWLDVPTTNNSIVINVGDMLSLLTKNYYPSTTHRVVNPLLSSNKSRYSMPLFLHPHSHCRLSETKTAGQYLKERLDKIYTFKGKT